MDFNCVRGRKPLEVCTKIPFNHAQEVNCNQVLEKVLDILLYHGIFQEVGEVVNI
jgi:hypothetical protein